MKSITKFLAFNNFKMVTLLFLIFVLPFVVQILGTSYISRIYMDFIATPPIFVSFSIPIPGCGSSTGGAHCVFLTSAKFFLLNLIYYWLVACVLFNLYEVLTKIKKKKRKS